MNVKTVVNLNKFAFTAGGSVSLVAGAGALVIESSEDKVSFMSDFDITRDAAGLALARNVVDVLLGAIQVLNDDKKAGRLPQEVVLQKPVVKANPLS